MILSSGGHEIWLAANHCTTTTSIHLVNMGRNKSCYIGGRDKPAIVIQQPCENCYIHDYLVASVVGNCLIVVCIGIGVDRDAVGLWV